MEVKSSATTKVDPGNIDAQEQGYSTILERHGDHRFGQKWPKPQEIKFARIDNSHQAKKAYVHNDENTRPEVVDDVSPEYLKELNS